MRSRFERRLRKFENGLSSTAERINASVGELCSADENYAYLVAERLPFLGTAALPALQRILADPESTGAARYLSAWVALLLGDRADSIHVLCEAVDAATKWSLPAANALARNGIEEGIAPVSRALDRVDPRDELEVVGYITALSDLGGRLTESTRHRLETGASPFAARVIANDFPGRH